MSTLREAAQQALEALDWLHEHGFTRDGPCTHETADALRAALAAPEQEPVGWFVDAAWGKSVTLERPDFGSATWKAPEPKVVPLYTAPPQRRPLTDEECDAVASALDNWARSVDHYEHGLPIYNEEAREVAREVIRAAAEIGRMKA